MKKKKEKEKLNRFIHKNMKIVIKILNTSFISYTTFGILTVLITIHLRSYGVCEYYVFQRATLLQCNPITRLRKTI